MDIQISYMTLIGVHSTIHLVHPNNYSSVCVCVCVCVFERVKEMVRWASSADHPTH